MSDDGFAQFYQRTFAQVLSATIMASGHRGDAEDAVQEAYIIALRRWAEVGGYDAPDAWVLKVAMRRLWRSQQQAPGRGAAGGDGSPNATPEETAYAREVLGALATLPPPVRIAMVMCAVLGWIAGGGGRGAAGAAQHHCQPDFPRPGQAGRRSSG